jgi:hypothetical protein
MLTTKIISPISWKNLILLDNALKIIQEFKKSGIDFLALKGLYFAFTIYPHRGLRSMADIDFLVKRKDLNKIDEILAGLGYAAISPKGQREYGCDVTFRNKKRGYIDIHWDLSQYERFRGIIEITDDFWKRACEFSLEGVLARTLSPEDHILYVGLHYGLVHLLHEGNKANAYDLFYLVDGIASGASRPRNDIDWERVIANAYKYKIKIPLYYSLHKTCQITSLKLPDFVLKCLEPHWLKKRIIEYLLYRHKATHLRYLCQALMVGNYFDTFRVLRRALKGLPRVYRRSFPAALKNIPKATI